MKNYVLSHFDLDGIVSVINVYNTIKYPELDFEYALTGYTSLEKKLKKTKFDNVETLWITDLNLNEDNIKSVYEAYVKYDISRVMWFDHHVYKFDVNEEIEKYEDFNIHFFYDKSVCAAYSVNQYLLANKCFVNETNIDKLVILSNITNIYDLWQRSDDNWKTAYAFNDLFFEYGFERFFAKFKHGFALDEESLALVAAVEADRDEYVRNTIKNHLHFNEECKTVYITNPKCKFTNHFSVAMYDVDNYVILKEVKEEYISYSIRLYNSQLPLTIQTLFDKIRNMDIEVLVAGGHDKVGSISIPPYENEKLLVALNEIFERYGHGEKSI